MKRQLEEEKTAYTYANTPIGKLLLIAQENSVVGIYTVLSQCCPAIEAPWEHDDRRACFQTLQQQLSDYFAGKRVAFTVDHPLLEGTPLQKDVWQQLFTIPYGEQISYKALAERTSYPKAIRAVASAVGKNRLLLVLPCHRVRRGDGTPVGFAAGLPIKQQLVDLEHRFRT